MSTVRDLIKGSLRLLGAISSGETPSAQEQADALSVLNEMIDSWSTERFLIYSRTREPFAFVGGKQTYTMGPGGDFDTTRPMLIEGALIAVATSPGYELPMEILDADQWAAISVKSTGSSIPTRVYPVYTAPRISLNFWPIPDGTNSLILESTKALSNVAVDDVLDLPPGFKRTLRTNLAIEIAPEYGLEPSAALVKAATESKANLKRQNAKSPLMVTDQGLFPVRRNFNYLTGE